MAAGGRSDEPKIRRSLLDRLLDDDPKVTSEPTWKAGISVDELRRQVRDDLARLLNTRMTHPELLGTEGHLADSLLTYGLPDIQQIPDESGTQRERFSQQVAATIERCEPRLQDVRVREVIVEGTADRTMHVVIAARLRVDPVPIPIQFDTVVKDLGIADRVEVRE